MKHLIFLCSLLIFSSITYSKTNTIISDGYLKAIELNVNDTLIYELKNKQKRVFVLKKTSSKPLFVYDNPANKWHSGIIYSMSCILEADGQNLELKRIVSAQQSYYEPWHINGVTFFFDAVKNIETFIKDKHGSTGGSAYPKKDARFAFIEYEDNFSSQPLGPWYPNSKNYLDIHDAYQGGDTWLGGFKKDESHNGLDVNIPNNTKLWAPVDFDEQFYFASRLPKATITTAGRA